MQASTSYSDPPIRFASIPYVGADDTFAMLLLPYRGEQFKMGTAKGVFGKVLIAAFSLFVALPALRAQEKSGDLDSYTWRVTALWWYSHPTGGFTASSDQVSFDLSRDFNFSSYSTFTGGFDWHFKRKHHFLFTASPVYSSRSDTLTRDITFRDVTYHLGAEVAVQFNSLAFAPGYQWDFIRRRQGYVALATAFNLLDSSGSITGTGSLNGISATRKSSGSVLAPIPVLGSTTRWYLIHDSPRLSLQGTFQGMYLFGYGSFYSANGKAQVKVLQHLNLTAGYQMGTRLKVKTDSGRTVGLNLTQKGPVAGIEASW
jgi:hypothetical protein